MCDLQCGAVTVVCTIFVFLLHCFISRNCLLCLEKWRWKCQKWTQSSGPVQNVPWETAVLSGSNSLITRSINFFFFQCSNDEKISINIIIWPLSELSDNLAVTPTGLLALAPQTSLRPLSRSLLFFIFYTACLPSLQDKPFTSRHYLHDIHAMWRLW